jgi:multimeric flavodoxin WrbA
MKVVAFNTSARKDGNTALMINAVLKELEAEGIATELVQLSGTHPKGCIACYKCFERKDQRCAVKNDILNECIEKMLDADGVIIGSPTYFANVTTEAKALIDRAGMVARANNDMFARKVGAAVAVARRAGTTHGFNSINHLFFISQMVVPGSHYWNLGYGKDIGEVSEDEEAMSTMRTLGVNMAWLMKKLNA